MASYNGEAEASSTDAAVAEDAAVADEMFYCSVCDMSFTGPTQHRDHLWHKDVWTGKPVPSKNHRVNLDRALEAAEISSGADVTFQARHAGGRRNPTREITVKRTAILNEFNTSCPGKPVPAYLQQRDAADEVQGAQAQEYEPPVGEEQSAPSPCGDHCCQGVDPCAAQQLAWEWGATSWQQGATWAGWHPNSDQSTWQGVQWI